jgi:hypothetical protein
MLGFHMAVPEGGVGCRCNIESHGCTGAILNHETGYNYLGNECRWRRSLKPESWGPKPF